MLLFHIAQLRLSIPSNWPDLYFREGKVYPMADQDVINLMFADSCRHLSLRYNYNVWFRTLSPAGLRLLMEDPTLCSFSDQEVADLRAGRGDLPFQHLQTGDPALVSGQTDPAGELWRAMYAQSPWAGQPFSAEPQNLTRGDRRDRRMYQFFGPPGYSPMYTRSTSACAAFFSRLLPRRGRKGN